MLNVWYIYLHLGSFLWVNVGKYTSPIEHLGMFKQWTVDKLPFSPNDLRRQLAELKVG